MLLMCVFTPGTIREGSVMIPFHKEVSVQGNLPTWYIDKFPLFPITYQSTALDDSAPITSIIQISVRTHAATIWLSRPLSSLMWISELYSQLIPQLSAGPPPIQEGTLSSPQLYPQSSPTPHSQQMTFPLKWQRNRPPQMRILFPNLQVHLYSHTFASCVVTVAEINLICSKANPRYCLLVTRF